MLSVVRGAVIFPKTFALSSVLLAVSGYTSKRGSPEAIFWMFVTAVIFSFPSPIRNGEVLLSGYKGHRLTLLIILSIFFMFHYFAF